MTLPEYFFADLPSTAVLTPEMVRESCFSLKRNRDKYLQDRSTASLIKLLAALAEDWLDPEYPFRRLALDRGPAATGFGRETLASGLDAFFRQLTHDQLNALLLQDLGHVQRLDDFSAGAEEARFGQAAMACGPELLVHITAGTLPTPTLWSLVLGLLARSAQFIKCARGSSLLPRLFAHSLYDREPKLAACLELAEWPGGSAALEQVLFEAADCVTATGTNETLAAIRRGLPPGVRFLGYGHRVSFGYLTREVLSRYAARKWAEAAARDIAAWNQLGCLSPLVYYVEADGPVLPEGFAELLAGALERQESLEPRGPVPVEIAAQIANLRACFEMRALNTPATPATRLWKSAGSTAWTVVYEENPLFPKSVLHRCVFVKATRNLTETLKHAEMVRGQVSTVGLAATSTESPALARQLARWGVTRICPIGRMQTPPLTWRHDGRPSFGDLVTWTDWEY